MSQILETAARFLFFLAKNSYMNTEETRLSSLCFFFMSHYWGFIMYYEYIMQLLGSERLLPSFSHTSILPLLLFAGMHRWVSLGPSDWALQR